MALLQALATKQKENTGYPYWPPFTFVELPDKSIGYISGIGKWGLYKVITITNGLMVEREVLSLKPLTDEDIDDE